MQLQDFTSNPYLFSAISAVGGIVLTVLTQRILNRRSLFTYYVRHVKIGTTVDDPIFGSIRVTWNDAPIEHLYTSTVEFLNESANDYENLTLTVFTNDCYLLSEATAVLDTTQILKFTDSFKQKLASFTGDSAVDDRLNLIMQRREYAIPTMNRRHLIRLVYLTESKTAEQPTVWLDLVHKGVLLRFRIPKPEFLGVPTNSAAMSGLVVGIFLIPLLMGYVSNIWILTYASFGLGAFAMVLGVVVLKIGRSFKTYFGG